MILYIFCLCFDKNKCSFGDYRVLYKRFPLKIFTDPQTFKLYFTSWKQDATLQGLLDSNLKRFDKKYVIINIYVSRRLKKVKI